MPKINLETRFQPSPEVVVRKIEGEIIIVPLTSRVTTVEDTLFTFNETGRIIWDHLDGKKSLKQIIQALQKTYPGNEKNIETDVCGLVRELFKRKIIEPVE